MTASGQAIKIDFRVEPNNNTHALKEFILALDS